MALISCACGRGKYDPERFNACFHCNTDGKVKCPFCDKKYVDPSRFLVCYTCKQAGNDSLVECGICRLPDPTVFWRNEAGTSLMCQNCYDDNGEIITQNGAENVAFVKNGKTEAPPFRIFGSKPKEVERHTEPIIKSERCECQICGYAYYGGAALCFICSTYLLIGAELQVVDLQYAPTTMPFVEYKPCSCCSRDKEPHSVSFPDKCVACTWGYHVKSCGEQERVEIELTACIYDGNIIDNGMPICAGCRETLFDSIVATDAHYEEDYYANIKR